MEGEGKTRRPLNKAQLETLRLLYRFRFATTDLIARREGKKNGTFTRSRLAILQEQGYIGRNFDKSYRLQGKFATYYLLPKGMQALKTAGKVDDKIIKALYNDKLASQQFIDHSVAVFGVACDLQALYGDAVQVFTKSDLAEYDYFPQPSPDAYISLKVGSKTKHFFLDVYQEATPFFVMVRRMKRYIAYADNGGWDVTESVFPVLLGVCETPSLQKRLQKRAAGLIEAEDSDIVFRTTTLEALSQATDAQAAVWSGGEDSGPAKPLHKL